MGGGYLYYPSWEPRLGEGDDPFDSALASIVSSPAAPSSVALQGDNSMIQELIDRLSTICRASFGGSGACSADTSCYGSPLNSPPKLGMSMMERNSRCHLGYPATYLHLPADTGLVETAARFSCFGGGNTMGASGSFAELQLRQGKCADPGAFSRVLSCQNAAAGSCDGNSLGNGAAVDLPEGSSISEQVPRLTVSNLARKRKFIARGQMTESPETSSAKHTELPDSCEKEQSDEKKSEDNNAKAPEPPKDYIHVRARRGQATDSHSLAERVRREKITQRMKVLQDLVPGCNKVTGKAVMLDVIINYVQSLQRQVEFLSMKLATLNPRMDFNVEAFMTKETSNPLRSSSFPADSSSPALPYGHHHHHQAMNLHGALGSNTDSQFPMNASNVAVHPGMDGSCEASSTRVTGLWEDELHSVVQTGFPPQRLQASSIKLRPTSGSEAAGQTKI